MVHGVLSGHPGLPGEDMGTIAERLETSFVPERAVTACRSRDDVDIDMTMHGLRLCLWITRYEWRGSNRYWAKLLLGAGGFRCLLVSLGDDSTSPESRDVIGKQMESVLNTLFHRVPHG